MNTYYIREQRMSEAYYAVEAETLDEAVTAYLGHKIKAERVTTDTVTSMELQDTQGSTIYTLRR